MLADAIRSESWRLLHNRTAVFWSVVFVPVISLVLAIGGYLFIQSKMSGVAGDLPPELKLDAGALDLGASLVEADHAAAARRRL